MSKDLTFVEVILADLWRRLLGLSNADDIADFADFFDLGGTSLVAVELSIEIQEQFAIILDAIDIVMQPQFGEMASVIAQRLAERT